MPPAAATPEEEDELVVKWEKVPKQTVELSTVELSTVELSTIELSTVELSPETFAKLELLKFSERV